MSDSPNASTGCSLVDSLLTHPAFAGFWASERRAILRHRAYLAQRRGVELSVEGAVREWEKGPAREWRLAKCRLDADRQYRAILEHKYFESQKCGYDIGLERAAIDWVCRFARDWREWWEKQDDSDPYASKDLDSAWAA